MKVDELKRRLMNTAIADCLRAADGGAILGSAILALCVLDYLSVLRAKYPKSAKRQWQVGLNYEALVNDYLSLVNPKYKGADIYWLRCALVHTYALADAKKDTKVRGYLLKHLDPQFHLAGPPKTLQINTDTFVADVIIATTRFLDAVVGDAGVETRANDLLIIQGGMIPATFKDMNGALAAFDEPTLDESNLRGDISFRYRPKPDHVASTTTTPLSGA